MTDKNINVFQYTTVQSASHSSQMRRGRQTRLAVLIARKLGLFRKDKACTDSDCCWQQDMSHHERAQLLYEQHDADLPRRLICYDCAVFHLRIQRRKNELWTYPVYCPVANQSASNGFFIRHRTELPVVLICGLSIPWLQLHQTARALRRGPQYGCNVLNDFRKQYRMLCILRRWQTESKALLVDDRLLVRIRSFGPLHHQSHHNPSHLIYPNAEFVCPHARETFLYSRHLANEMVEAYRLLSNDYDNRRMGFVHKRYRCTQCPTELIIEVVLAGDFDAAHVFGEVWLNDYHYMLCMSRYIDFGHCHSPDEMEWKSLSTWPKERPEGDWGPTEQVDNTRPALDLTGMEYISARFDRELRESDRINSPR
ncbi:hypothetical protein SVAN01_11536 [Stagonosporopsis vannaccii]|nr:hypothetical protein SVAN01_11536 [Stagonosporopsis vannaccii]